MHSRFGQRCSRNGFLFRLLTGNENVTFCTILSCRFTDTYVKTFKTFYIRTFHKWHKLFTIEKNFLQRIRETLWKVCNVPCNTGPVCRFKNQSKNLSVKKVVLLDCEQVSPHIQTLIQQILTSFTYNLQFFLLSCRFYSCCVTPAADESVKEETKKNQGWAGKDYSAFLLLAFAGNGRCFSVASVLWFLLPAKKSFAV